MEKISLKLLYSIRPIIKNVLPKKDTSTVLLDRVSAMPWLVDWCAEKIVGTYLISFPKAGRTWLRLMIGRALQRHFELVHPDILNLIVNLDDQLARLHPNVPRIRVKHDDEPHGKIPEQLVKSKANFKYAKIIFLSRDPRDVIISTYFYFTKRPNDPHNIKAHDLSSFLRSPKGGFDTLLTYYNIWAENKNVPRDFLLVRYEDMHINPHKELRKVLNFLSLQEISDEVISEAVEFASFSNMRNLEEKNTFNLHMQGFQQSDKESYHVRKGKVGGYREYLNEEDIEYLNSRMENLLSKDSQDLYGYS
ncbi:MAG: sulfotransferase domain-containing protein [Aphanothece sp. CMT-3BRIN-NPC111]|jgi:hypothetical protein|nr:sulfotransferase domain-containing protein [Aphanothece sp. CMT-3BRIN-NPC111]